MDGVPEENFTPRLIDMYWTKGAAVVVCLGEETRDWLASNIPNLRAREGSRIKMVGLDALPTYKRVVAWFTNPVKDTGRYLQRLRRLNRGLYMDNWWFYERKEEANGSALCLVKNLRLSRRWGS